MSLSLAKRRRVVFRALATARDKFPITLLGWLVLLAAYELVHYFGRQRQDLVLHVAGFALVGLVVLSLLIVSTTTISLRLRWQPKPRSPARHEADTVVVTGFSLPSLGWVPFVSLDWRWQQPSSVAVDIAPERGRLVEHVTFLERGEHSQTVRRVIVTDVFGLTALGFTIVETTPRMILPSRGRVPALPLHATLSAGDAVSNPLGPPEGDLIEMRRYAPGDPMKHVLWKTYARSRTLMVRLPEKAQAPARRTLAFLVAGDADEAASGLARLALESGALGADWRFGADGSPGDASHVDDALDRIVRSSAARPLQGQGLAPFLAQTAPLGRHRTLLFVPARPGPWLAHVAAAIGRRNETVDVLVGIDGLRDDHTTRPWKKLLLRADASRRGPPPAAVRSRDIEEIAAGIGTPGARVWVIDRTTGRQQNALVLRRAA